MTSSTAQFLALAIAGVLACGSSLSAAQSTSGSPAESIFDNFSPAAYERLLSQAAVAIESGRYADARQGISDAIQIIKVNHGLLSPIQFPALQMLAESFIVQRDWQGLDQHLAYFEWLLNKLSINDLDDYLAGTEILHRLYLTAAADTRSPQNALYLINAKQLNWRTVTLLEVRFGKDNLVLAPWLYNIVLTHFYQASMTRRRGMTSFDYKTDSTELVSGWSLSKNESVQQSYNIGVELLQRIRALYAQSAISSPTIDGLMTLHVADWELLFNRGNNALTNYQQAYATLQAANVPTHALQHLFSQPLVIPEPAIVDTLPADLPGSDAKIRFEAWSPVFPGAVLPPDLPRQHHPLATVYSAHADLEMGPAQAPGSDPVLVFQYPVTQVFIKSMIPEHNEALAVAEEQISSLQFRPVLAADGGPVGKKVQLDYVFSFEASSAGTYE